MRSSPRAISGRIIGALLIGIACLAAARLGMMLAADRGAITAIWPASRIALAVAFIAMMIAAIVAQRQPAHASVVALNRELEQRIAARTTELESTNAQLRTQIADRQRAEESLRHERNRFAEVVAIHDAIADAGPNLDDVLRMMAERARKLVGGAAAEISFAEGDDVICRVSTDRALERSDVRVKLNRGLSGACLQSNQVILCNDVEQDDRADLSICQRIGLRSVILVPLRPSGRAIALLSVHSPQPGAFAEGDVQALQLLAGFLEKVMSHVAAFEEKRTMLAEKTAALEALREAQERFVAFMDNSPAVAFMKDQAGRMVYQSAGFCQRVVPPGQDWLGKTNFDLFPPEIAAQLQEHDRAVLDSGKPAEFIESAHNAEGRFTHWLAYKFPLRDRTGRVYLGGQAVDITDRIEAERSLRDGQERLATALSASQTGTYRIDLTTNRVEIDDELCRLFGNVPRSRVESIDRWSALIHPDDRTQASEQWHKLIETGEPFNADYRIVWPDGSTHWLHDKCRTFRDDTGRPIYVSGACADVTDRKRSEQALAASERFARATVDALSTHMAILDESGTITAVNLAWRQFAQENGLPHANAGVGINYLEVCDRARGDELAGAAATGIRLVISTQQTEFYLEYPCHSPGVERWFAMRVTRFESDGIAQIVIAHENITSRKTAERLDRERASLGDAVRAMEQVLGVVGHELRTPLAALRAISEYLITDGARTTEELESFLGDMSEEVDRMSYTVNNILEAARLNSGKARWNWSEVDLVEICNDAIETVRPLVDSDRVGLFLRVDSPECPMLGDGEALRRLLINLLNNARKNTTRGKIELAVHHCENDGHRWIRIAVRDTGCGMTPEVLARLGEAFALNAGVVGGSQIGGTGLGLAIVKGIAAAHAGVVRFASAPGQGTTASVLLRADLTAACQGATSSASEYSPASAPAAVPLPG